MSWAQLALPLFYFFQLGWMAVDVRWDVEFSFFVARGAGASGDYGR